MIQNLICMMLLAMLIYLDFVTRNFSNLLEIFRIMGWLLLNLLTIAEADIKGEVFPMLFAIIRVFGDVLIGVGRPCSQRKFNFHLNKVHFSKIRMK